MPNQLLSEDEAQEWKDWLAHPMTQRLRRFAAARRVSIKDQWEAAGFAAPSQFEMICANIEAQAMCKALSLLEELDYSSIVQEIDDEERKWFDTSGASGLGPAVRAGEAIKSDRDA